MFKIAISGKANSGKDTLCKVMVNLILEHYSSFEFKSLSFATPVKKIASILFPQIPKEHLYGSSKLRSEIVQGITLNGKPVTVRDILIDIGESYKKYDENIFVNIFDNKSSSFCKNDLRSKFLFATDVRFPQEFNYVKNNGFITIRIIRDDCLSSNHSTETVQEKINSNKFDYIIYNNKTLEDLKRSAKNTFEEIIYGS